MKKFILLFLICRSVLAQNIINLDDAKSDVKMYYESGKYERKVKTVIDSAKEMLSKLKLRENSVIVFDVDDTILSGYEYTKSIGFGFTFETWKEHILKAEQKSVPGMYAFYKFVLNRGMKVIFLTGRDEAFYKATKKNLVKNGFDTFDTLICRTTDEKKLSAVEYKNIKRRELTERGYFIAATIGDQRSDLEGDYTGLKFKLPNYLYRIE